MIKIAVAILFSLLLGVFSHPVKDIASPQKVVVEGYVNQARFLPIPFRKCFKIQPQLEANKKYMEFKPTRIELNPIKKYSLKNEGSTISTLQQLLSPIIYKHSNILSFSGFLLIFLAPNTIIVVEESTAGFSVRNKYKVQGLDRFDKFKIYEMGSKGLMIINNKKKAYLLGETGYEVYQFDSPSTIVHLTTTNGHQFWAAQFMKGLTHYKINQKSKQIEVVRKIAGEELKIGANLKYVVDVSLNFQEEGILLALDAEVGLIQIVQIGSQFQGKVVVPHKMCESFDSVERNHIVLLCQNQGHSTIIQVYRQFNFKTKLFSYRKLQPIFQGNYLNDLHLTDSFYLVYSYKDIHVFWNTQKHRLPETLETQSQIILPALETFTFVRDYGLNYLYTVEGGMLIRYRLEEKAAEVVLKSSESITKTFKLFLYGSCQDVEDQDKSKNEKKVEACRLSKTVTLQIGQEQYPRQQDFGISASIVAILIIVFLMVIWICLKKYKGLEQEARRVLKNYQSKRVRGI